MDAGDLITGRYRLTEPIGSGGMGVVWLAVDERDGGPVAVKRARSADVDGARGRRRLRGEAGIVAGLKHPGIVRFLDVVGEGAQPWLVMEYVAGPDLGALIERDGPLPPRRVAALGAQLAAALAAVHACGVVHRDVKPGNVLVPADGPARLTDFGISRAVNGDATLSQAALVAGTPAYLAPEVANGEQATAAADLFSLGATLFAAVQGCSPFGNAGDNPLAVLRRAAAGVVPPATRAGPLGPVLSALLRPDPADRPDACQARRLLAAVAEDREPGAGQPVRRRLGARIGAVAGVVVLLSGLPVLMAASPPPAAPAATPVIGAEHSADPCALTDAVALARFGATEVDTDYGSFNRCDVIVRHGTGVVDVKYELRPALKADGPVRQLGRVRIVREQGGGDQCRRALQLPEATTVTINARHDRGERADLCAIADVAATRTAEILDRAPLARRGAPPELASLARLDACALLPAEALRRVPGIDPGKGMRGFGGWECRWRSTTDPVTVLIIFDRDQPPSPGEDGVPHQVGDRRFFLRPDGWGPESCLARISHRSYPDQHGQQASEILGIALLGRTGHQRLCAQATDLAHTALASLPST
ncbi:serine/threonine-protein kinase [Crossiella sp. CA198]|uniref:serine/threonine-protein kinase n=1 Tax=Crossiella sp. CA198 TaxID=3455607 RepID=UPI003F8D3AFB